MKNYCTKDVQIHFNSHEGKSKLRSAVLKAFCMGMVAISLTPTATLGQQNVLTKKIDLHVHNKTAEEALQQLGQQLGYRFSYNNQDLNTTKKLDNNFQNISVRELLNKLLGSNAQFQVSGNQIYVQFGAEKGGIKGYVQSSDGKPVEGVTVSIKGVGSTAVDKQANFSFRNVPVGTHIVTVSYVGLASKSQKVKVAKDETTSIDFTLDGDAMTLKEIYVNSHANSQNSYTVQLAAVGNKIAVPLKDIPNSVSVITRKLMDDQNMVNLSDAMNQATGVTAMPYGDGSYYYQTRGYQSDIQYDGVPSNNGVQYLPQFDLAMYDRVEILRGSAGLLQGSGSAAGVVNLARKRPLSEFGVAGALFAGSWNNFKGNIDLSTPLDRSGKLKGRFVLAGEDRDYFFDKAKSKRGLGYAILEYAVDSKTALTFSASHQNDKTAPFDYGAGVRIDGTFLDAPRSSFFGTDWSTGKNKLTELYFDATHKINTRWHAKLSVDYRKFALNSDYGYVSSRVSPENIARYTAQFQEVNMEWLGIDANLTGSFDLFGRTHQLAVGMNYAVREEDSKGSSKNYQNIDIFNITVPKEDVPFNSGDKSNIAQYGIYAQTRLKVWDPLTVVLGGRVSHYQSKTKDTMPKVDEWTKNPAVKGQFTPYAGIVYALTKQINAYGSYANVFAAQTQLKQSGKVLDPRQGNQLEGGVKGGFFNDQLNASVAYFYVKDKNRAIPDPEFPTFFLANGKVRSKGLEAEVSGSPIKGLNIITGYTYLETKYIDDPKNIGNIFSAEEPKHTVKVWSNYDFQSGLLKNANVGLGVRAVTKANRGAAVQAGYAVANAQVGYAFASKWSVKATLSNVFDKVYYARIPSNFFGVYGEPRNFMVTLRKGF